MNFNVLLMCGLNNSFTKTKNSFTNPDCVFS